MSIRDKFIATAKTRFQSAPAKLPADWPDRDKIIARGLSGLDKDFYEGYRIRFSSDGRGGVKSEFCYDNITAQIVVRGLFDSEGSRIFTNEDATIVGRDIPGDVLEVLHDQIVALTPGLKKKKEEPEKNDSPATGGVASSAGLPASSAALTLTS